MNYLLEIWQYISIGIRYLIKQIGKISYTPQPQLKNTVPNHKEIMVSYFIIVQHLKLLIIQLEQLNFYFKYFLKIIVF